MAKSIQGFVLFNALKGAGDKGLTREQVAKVLNVHENSVPVYIFDLKKFYKAEVENIKEGRRVVGYILTNANSVAVPSNGRRGGATPVVTKKAPVAAAKPTPTSKTVKNVAKPATKDKDMSMVTFDKDLDIVEISDREFADIRSQLGL